LEFNRYIKTAPGTVRAFGVATLRREPSMQEQG
jgi:hypothetical protein